MNARAWKISIGVGVGLLLSGCATPVANKYPANEMAVLRAYDDFENMERRAPASQDVIASTAALDAKTSQTPDGVLFATSTLSELQGTWSSKCTKAYGKKATLWFKRTLRFEDREYSSAITQYSDGVCAQPLKQVINFKIKIETPVSTYYGMRLTNNWTEARQIVSSPEMNSKSCSKETIFSGCKETANESPRKSPWLLATLSGADELYTDKYSAESADCVKAPLVNGEKWCLLLTKEKAPRSTK